MEFKLIVKYQSCELKHVDSYPLIGYVYEINGKFIFAMRLVKNKNRS